MLRRLKQLRGFTIAATDDDIGSVGDFYFEDDTWFIRYVIVDTGPWLLGRQVLISPVAVKGIDWEANKVFVNLTKKQVEDSPSIYVDEPVSRQHEIDLHNYYGWPGYWYGAPGLAVPVGAAAIPSTTAPADEGQQGQDADVADAEERGDPHLRSVDEIHGYDIQATDDNIGHVEDFLAEEEDWRIRYILVDTRNWLPGRTVLVGIDWVDKFDWAQRDIFVNVTREQVKNSPEYDPQIPLSRRLEETLHEYYGFSRYWF